MGEDFKRLVCTAVSPDKTMFFPESFPFIYEAHIVCWTPLRQPAISDIQLNMSLLVRLGMGSEKTTEYDIILVKLHTSSIALARNFKFTSMSSALAPGILLTVSTGVFSFMFKNRVTNSQTLIDYFLLHQYHLLPHQSSLNWMTQVQLVVVESVFALRHF